ncbi:MAG: LysR family transcriptional regulator [Pseudomonadota bacterium]
MNFRQLSTFVGIYEEGSFNKAALRLNATQSGLSMQIKNLEEGLGCALFDRTAKGVTPTLAGTRLYSTAVAILRQLDGAEADLRNLSGTVSGRLRVGLMPTFTRGMLAPVLSRFLADYPNVEVSIVEAYSALLIDKLAEGDVDFAIVPKSADRDGIRSRHLGADREFLVRRPGGALPHLAPVRLADLPPLHLVLPTPGNARRDRLDTFFATNGLPVASIVSMDAMIATLEFVADSDYATILPATICGKDMDGTARWLHPIISPALSVSYAVIEPAKKTLSPAATIFLQRLEAEYLDSDRAWQRVLTEVGADDGHRET